MAPAAVEALLEGVKSRLAYFGVEGLSLPSYKQKGCGQADFPYLQAILVFSLVMFLFGAF